MASETTREHTHSDTARIEVTEEFLLAESEQFRRTLRCDRKSGLLFKTFSTHLRIQMLAFWAEHKLRWNLSKLQWFHHCAQQLDQKQGFNEDLLSRKVEELELQTMRLSAEFELVAKQNKALELERNRLLSLLENTFFGEPHKNGEFAQDHGSQAVQNGANQAVQAADSREQAWKSAIKN